MDYDVIVIGAGHNSLTCAAYLARAGKSVLVLEAAPVIGGATQTQEFHPGYRNSVYAYALSLLHPQVITDLKLKDYGLDIIEKQGGNLSLLNDDVLVLGKTMSERQREIARYSQHDAQVYPLFEAEIETVAVALRALAQAAPPGLSLTLRNLPKLARSAKTLASLSLHARTTLAELMTRSLGDYLNSWFESDALKGLLGLECAIGNFVDPYATGSAYVLLHHAFGEVNGKSGAWGHARGGMGSVSQAIAGSACAAGAQIETDNYVEKIL
ncbi:MAG: NAD(P)/FAD-dependent oxidoreductase, partial [Proteobacteria bacterium]|nr:NAD(P)/FAD-dependent oxidoreductase [Pseudomonadota bacterium]